MVAIIPARGGSKRIPRKNIRPMLGKPLFQYSVELALNSQLFDDVIVSTDDDEIAERAKDLGVTVHRRSQVSDEQVLQEVWDMFPKPLCCLLPNPLTKVQDVVEASFLPHDVWSVIRTNNDPPIFQDAGQFYFIRGGAEPRKILFEVTEAVDINTPEDWALAESKLHL